MEPSKTEHAPALGKGNFLRATAERACNPAWPLPVHPPTCGSVPSLTQLLEHHRCIAVLDSASTQVHVGLLRADQAAIWRTAPGEAGTALFAALDATLTEAGLTIGEVRAWAFCSGPGSVLGIRTAAMAIRTWQTTQPTPAYAYESLPLLASGETARGRRGPLTFIADARRDAWHAVGLDANGKVTELQRLPRIELADTSEPLYLPSAFRAWAEPPRPAEDCSYEPAKLLAAATHVDLFTAAPEPDAHLTAPPEYKKWDARIHQAPSAPR